MIDFNPEGTIIRNPSILDLEDFDNKSKTGSMPPIEIKQALHES